MVTDQQVRRLMKLMQTEKTFALAGDGREDSEEVSGSWQTSEPVPPGTSIKESRPGCFLGISVFRIVPSVNTAGSA